MRRDRFGLVYLLANTETNERLRSGRFVNEPDLAVPSVVQLVGRGQLARTRGVGYVRDPLRGASRPAANSPARGVHRASAPQRLSAQGRGERHNFPVITRAES